MCAVVGPGHRLAGKKRISLAELEGEKLLSFAGHKSQTHADLVSGIFAANGLKAGPTKIVEGFESLLAMIAGGQGVSLMPQHISLSGADKVEIIPLKEASDDLVFELSAVWHDQETSPLARNFVDLLREPRAPARRKSARSEIPVKGARRSAGG
jgi:DNA-binding transcriptional LysR family regulator